MKIMTNSWKLDLCNSL